MTSYGDPDRLRNLTSHLRKKTIGGAAPSEYEEKFLYTLSDGGEILTREQRWFYEQNGYLVIPDLIPHSIIDQCRERFVDLCEGRVEKNVGLIPINMMKDISLAKGKGQQLQGEALYYKASDIISDPIFKQYFTYEKLLDIVGCITGKDILAMHTMLINKPPDMGSLSSQHPPHQDLFYFPFRPADKVVAAWTAMEPVSITNGCLYVLPGTHRGGVIHPHEYPKWEGGVNMGFHGIPDMYDVDKTFVPMSKGDTVFFHPLLIHGSGYNSTKGYRKAISAHYACANCYYVDMEGTVQDPAAIDLARLANRLGCDGGNIKEFFRYKSVLVRGEQ